MSKYDKASLVMIPSGYKAEKLYSVLPVNGDGDFTHDRNLGTATRVNKDGLIETVAADKPRLDYPIVDGVVQDCPALLLEPAATQLIQYSEAFDNGYWTKGNSTVTANDAISPDGTQNADLLDLSAAGGNIYRSISTTNDHSFSIFAKYVDAQYIRLRLTGAYAYFDIKNGTIGTLTNADSAKIEDYGNGWFRCTVIDDNANTIAQVFVSDTDGSNTGTGSVHLYGAQLEAGSYPTSYIPTSGSSVTRNADVCNSAGTAAEFNNSEGVLYGDISRLGTPDSSEWWLISINDNTNQNVVAIGFNQSDGNLYGRLKAYNSSQFENTSTSSVTGQSHKLAIRYSSNEAAFFIDGFKKVTISNPTAFTGTLQRLDFNFGGGTSPFYSKSKELAVFKEALTDSELESLTSWDSFNEMATRQEYTIR